MTSTGAVCVNAGGLLALLLCGSGLAAVEFNEDPYASTYVPPASKTTAIVNATVLDGNGGIDRNADVLLEGGRILAVGRGVRIPAHAEVIDGTGKWVTPGIVDIHSHIGLSSLSKHGSLLDHNEKTSGPVAAEVMVEHSIWPQDPAFVRALEGGITTMLVLPGSHNLIGGRGVTLKNVPSRTREGMKFPGAPYSLKMACGEGPKKHHGARGGPSTRMGSMARFRSAWIQAGEYRRRWDEYLAVLARGTEVSAPGRDLRLETLAAVLRGDILVHVHCYRADELVTMINLSREFGFRISAFHHAAESYKVADYLRSAEVCSAMWADWWGFSLEAFDGIDENAAMVASRGACAIIHSDNIGAAQRLNQEVAKAWAAGRRIGLDITKGQAFAWITSNPARAMGIDDQTGSLEPGKMADVVLWSGDPFSTYTLTDKVFVDGVLLYDRSDRNGRQIRDLELGLVTASPAR